MLDPDLYITLLLLTSGDLEMLKTIRSDNWGFFSEENESRDKTHHNMHKFLLAM